MNKSGIVKDYIQEPFQKFFNLSSASSLVLLIFTLIAIAIANSPWNDTYQEILHTKASIRVGNFELSKSILHWINDGIMTIFFFVIGLELKREIIAGELSDRRKASLPIVAAIGGIAIPVAIFMLINNQPENARAWAIPMATDIAFTFGILKLLGNRVPHGLKVFLTAFAIADDLGAILVIAIFYTSGLKTDLLLIAGGIIILMAVMTRLRMYQRHIYLFLSLIVWYLVLKSGIHATIAGVLLAFTIPMYRKKDSSRFKEIVSHAISRLSNSSMTGNTVILNKDEIGAIDTIETAAQEFQSPLQYKENRLHFWVSWFIMPLFAFANAGVHFKGLDPAYTNLIIAIIVALVLGKALGISLFSIFSIKIGLSDQLKGVNNKQLISLSFLGGLGFTMSLFIANLAFDDVAQLDAAKLGILIGSALAGVIGYLLLNLNLAKSK